MHAWERRLADLSHLLAQCGAGYFDPDKFRQNTNQFLQTARTVTFIIQKNKEAIPGFEAWYRDHVIEPWRIDTVMQWAKDARNVVEKEGDLDMFSSLTVTLVFTHRGLHDVSLESSGSELLGANLERLYVYALSQLPPSTADGALLRVERRWVANSLPSQELILAMTYTYGRIYEVCAALAKHLGTTLDSSVAHPTSLDPTKKDVSHTRFIKIGKPGVGRIAVQRINRDPAFEPPKSLIALRAELKAASAPTSIEQAVAMAARVAKYTFEEYGCHIPTLALFNDRWIAVDHVAAHFSDQAEKFALLRHVTERAAYLRAFGIIFISESWVRDMTDAASRPLRELPIIDERLNVFGADLTGQRNSVKWRIVRPSAEIAELEVLRDPPEREQVFFLDGVLDAMRRVRGLPSLFGGKKISL